MWKKKDKGVTKMDERKIKAVDNIKERMQFAESLIYTKIFYQNHCDVTNAMTKQIFYNLLLLLRSQVKSCDLF